MEVGARVPWYARGPAPAEGAPLDVAAAASPPLGEGTGVVLPSMGAMLHDEGSSFVYDMPPVIGPWCVLTTDLRK
ncbi:hypothetical protein C7C46_12870 [Streptomyces tateyamensis]|uniref:Uncharacterized protein n=1 Tax=Streptomyces tateyamensis TaxID=565073 RepID=A0A2V4NB23_9ACTN|nr:hypothetical protein C7C46_12870 [Streptomyces tateyamensis]